MSAPAQFRFEVVPGIFQQSLPETDWQTFDFSKDDMGLLAQTPSTPGSGTLPAKPWERLMQYIEHLRAVAEPDVQYKLILNGRHGQGYHNVIQDKYGRAEWESYYCKLDAVDGYTLTDARLTPLGEEQAQIAGGVLQRQIMERGLPAPESYYVSPLTRCLQTAHLTWWFVQLPKDKPFEPVVKESFREVIGRDTCDKRSSRSEILKAYPEINIEAGFAEEDLLWRPDHRETHDEHDIRVQAVLDDIFTNDPATVISITSHAGSVNCLLRVVHHQVFRLGTGAVIPLLVKATRI